MRILVHSPEGFLFILAHNPAEAGPRRVDKDQIAHIQQAAVVIDDLVRRPFVVLPIGRDHPPRPKRTQARHPAPGKNEAKPGRTLGLRPGAVRSPADRLRPRAPGPARPGPDSTVSRIRDIGEPGFRRERDGVQDAVRAFQTPW